MSRELQKKICLMGAFAVGKTSLVGRFVSGIFSEKYLSTMGVKIDRKAVKVDDTRVNLMIWDLHGEEKNKKVPTSYLRGSAGFLLVIDGTRPATVATARELAARMRAEVGEVPFVVLVNKCDLQDEWVLADADIEALQAEGWECYKTSACTGEHVESAFMRLVEKMVK